MFAAAVSAQDAPAENTENETTAKIIQVQPDAKTFSVRRGFAEIISAEISKQKPVFADENRQDISPFGENSDWAQLILELPAGRGLSRFDFALEWNGQTCPCMAVAAEDTPYSMMKETWSIAKLQQPGKIRAVFAMPADAMTGGNVGPVLLVRKIGGKSALPPDQVYLRPAETFTTAAAAAEALKEKPKTEGKPAEIKEDTAAQAQTEEKEAKTTESKEVKEAVKEAVQEVKKEAEAAVPEKSAPPAEPVKTQEAVAPAPAPAKTETPAPAPAIQLNFSL